jgi:hypothetical protein
MRAKKGNCHVDQEEQQEADDQQHRTAPGKRKKIVSLAEYEADKKAGKPAPATEAPAPGAAPAGDVPPRSKKSAKADKPAKERKPGGLDAAVRVLREAGTPMNCGDIVKTALEKGYWQTKGRTPAGTIYAAVIREIAVKGDKSRFRKTDRGMFTLAK